ncbi:hypothetical protein H0H92_008157 [Tricholoma furcatifolium]|nr:hypothetical protein H0H92_008157 [Tricholoma furcatifolium]
MFCTTAGATKHYFAKHVSFPGRRRSSSPTQSRPHLPDRNARASPPVPLPPSSPLGDDPLPPLSPPFVPDLLPQVDLPTPPLSENGEAQGHERIEYHPKINGLPCNEDGQFLAQNAPPPPWELPASDDYFPYDDRHQFELADLLFRRNEMSASVLNDLMQIWAARNNETDPPFQSTQHLHETIDSTPIGGAPWESFSVYYNGEVTDDDVERAPWKVKGYDVWYRNPLVVLRNQLGNRDFDGEMDFAPKRVFDDKDRRCLRDFMSGNWAWRQADTIARDPANHGSTFCPVIMGSDKTTVSVMTGHTEYYPLYISNGLIYNNVRRAHRNGLTLIAFLAIPKTDAEHADTNDFRKFRRSLFHESLRMIFETLRPYMTAPDIVRFADGYFRRVIYGFGPYIADYPEQVLLACIVQGWCARCTARFDNLDGPGGRRSHELTESLFESLGVKALWDDYGIISGILPFTHYFPRADIHELLAPDLLHQLIKGTFKDHLVTWVNDYLEHVHTPAEAAKIVADIDRRIAAVPPFPGLRRFPEGRGFKQWTGDDSKALMKVYLPAISGHVPPQMVEVLQYFLEFCYLVRRSTLNEDDLLAIDKAVENFHHARTIFREVGVRPDGFSLPRQHSIVHYRHLIQEFGAPNGLCSSITESAHIRAIKKPWRRSSRYQALGQMLLINQRNDKLAASRVDFTSRGMLKNSLFVSNLSPLTAIPDDREDGDGGAIEDREIWGEVILAKKPITSIPLDIQGLAHHFSLPSLPELVSRFLYEQAHPGLEIPLVDVPIDECPLPDGRVRVYPSAIARFYAPSNVSGIGEGFRGLHVARVRLFFDITRERRKYSCALVTWFSTVGDEPCAETGMWIVKPDYARDGERIMSVIHIDTILRGAHLIGRAGLDRVPRRLLHSDSLDAFQEFYVNKYIDHHSHEIAC